MASMRRDGFTIVAIAERVGVSERTVRRYVRGVAPAVQLPSELSSDDLAEALFDQILDYRRGLVAAASEYWSESFDLDLTAVDSAMKTLRECLAGMEEVSIRRLSADESLRAEFADEFLAQMGREWASQFNTIRMWRSLVEQSEGYQDRADMPALEAGA